MKKLFVLAFGALLALTSCVQAGTNSSAIPSIEAPVSSSTDGINPLPSSIDDDDRWDAASRKTMVDTLGMVLPEAKHDEFLLEEKVDNYGDPCLWVYCFFEGHTSTVADPKDDGKGDSVIQGAILDYIDLLTDENWSINYNKSYNAYICDFEFGTKGIEIWVLEGAVHGKEALGIYATTYVVIPENSWPSALLEEVIGKDIPKFVLQGQEKITAWEQEGDEYSGGSPYVGIAITGVNDPSEVGDRYAKTCTDAGYTVKSAPQNDGAYNQYLAYLSEFVAPCILSYYDTEYNCFYIFALAISARQYLN